MLFTFSGSAVEVICPLWEKLNGQCSHCSNADGAFLPDGLRVSIGGQALKDLLRVVRG